MDQKSHETRLGVAFVKHNIRKENAPTVGLLREMVFLTIPNYLG
jgi:hypothetical protein